MNQLGYPDFVRIVGTSLKDPDSRHIFDSILEKPLVSNASQDHEYIDLRKLGITFCIIRPALVIHEVFLYAEGVNQSSQYKGSLPSGIKFGLQKADVISRCGIPNNESTVADYPADYASWRSPNDFKVALIYQQVVRSKRFSLEYRFNPYDQLILVALVSQYDPRLSTRPNQPQVPNSESPNLE